MPRTEFKTFTLTYGSESTTPGKEQDRRWARWVAEKYGTEHHEETIQFASFPESIRQILRCFDEPFAGVVSSYFLSQLIAQHVKVALSGDGADELFGSYLSHRLAQPLARYPEYAVTGDQSLIPGFERSAGVSRQPAGRRFGRLGMAGEAAGLRRGGEAGDVCARCRGGAERHEHDAVAT